MKPERSPGTGTLPTDAHRPDDGGDVVGTGRDGVDDLDEAHHLGRVEEVHPDDVGTAVTCARSMIGRTMSSWRGSPRLADAVEVAEWFLLDREVLGDGLDDDVGVRESSSDVDPMTRRRCRRRRSGSASALDLLARQRHPIAFDDPVDLLLAARRRSRGTRPWRTSTIPLAMVPVPTTPTCLMSCFGSRASRRGRRLVVTTTPDCRPPRGVEAAAGLAEPELAGRHLLEDRGRGAAGRGPCGTSSRDLVTCRGRSGSGVRGPMRQPQPKRMDASDVPRG